MGLETALPTMVMEGPKPLEAKAPVFEATRAAHTAFFKGEALFGQQDGEKVVEEAWFKGKGITKENPIVAAETARRAEAAKTAKILREVAEVEKAVKAGRKGSSYITEGDHAGDYVLTDEHGTEIARGNILNAYPGLRYGLEILAAEGADEPTRQEAEKALASMNEFLVVRDKGTWVSHAEWAVAYDLEKKAQTESKMSDAEWKSADENTKRIWRGKVEIDSKIAYGIRKPRTPEEMEEQRLVEAEKITLYDAEEFVGTILGQEVQLFIDDEKKALEIIKAHPNTPLARMVMLIYEYHHRGTETVEIDRQHQLATLLHLELKGLREQGGNKGLNKFISDHGLADRISVNIDTLDQGKAYEKPMKFITQVLKDRIGQTRLSADFYQKIRYQNILTDLLLSTLCEKTITKLPNGASLSDDAKKFLGGLMDKGLIHEEDYQLIQEFAVGEIGSHVLDHVYGINTDELQKGIPASAYANFVVDKLSKDGLLKGEAAKHPEIAKRVGAENITAGMRKVQKNFELPEWTFWLGGLTMFLVPIGEQLSKEGTETGEQQRGQ